MSFLMQAFVYLVAAVLTVPVANRLGLGSVLGYLVAGVIIGPYALGLVGQQGDAVMHFAEYGVVMMLFLVGLELRPSELWRLRKPILGMGGVQVLATGLLLAGGAWAAGISWRAALATGAILALSSTAIVVQSLRERNMLQSEGGQATSSVLLFQDIAVIPLIALLPLLATLPRQAEQAVTRAPWLQALIVVVAVVLSGRFLVGPLFRFLARTRLREMFTAAALLLVVGITLLMEAAGLSAALGTFIAGVVLAESEYHHELEGDIDPFKGLLLGLFFISVGAGIDFSIAAARPLVILGAVVGFVVLKLLVLYGVARVFGLRSSGRWLFAFALAQGGEFAFVMLSFAEQNGILAREMTAPIVAIVALSMLVTPVLFILLERVVLKRVSEPEAERQADEIPVMDNPVVMAGFGRFGQIVGRLLRMSGIRATVLDLDPEIVEGLARIGFKTYYGDASRLELLHAAGCERAKLFVLAIDDRDKSLIIARAVREHFPHLPVLARAFDRVHLFELRRAGVTAVFRETYDSALAVGVAALRALGMRAHRATRAAQLFAQHDQERLDELAQLWGDENLYIAAARRAQEESERLLRDATQQTLEELDAAWDNETLREEVAPLTSDPVQR